MKICDLTQFYSPVSGGVKRYVHEKIAYIDQHSPEDSHVLIVPGARTELIHNERSKIYSIRSPLISRSSRYRALIDLRAVGDIVEREWPDIIESGDPYQLGWKAILLGRTLHIPVVAFYHSHFPEVFLRSSAKFFGAPAARAVMTAARAYVRNLYNQFQATLVPSESLARVLMDWQVKNVYIVRLGVDAKIFNPAPDDGGATRESLGVSNGRKLLLYVGRLAPEKNTATLFDAFDLLQKRRPGCFHLLVIGDGPQRDRLTEQKNSDISWIQYCADSPDLARYYRAADLFVHPGVQETFGLVALEAQACGTPVVGIRGSYMDRIIFHEQEWWARENSPAALADAIEESINLKLSLLGRNAATAAGLYSWPRVFEHLFCIYRDICAKYPRL